MADSAKRGLFRIQMGFITQHSVHLMFEPYGPFEVAEDHYREEGYEPHFEMLPWKAEYEGNSAITDSQSQGDTGSTENDQEIAGAVNLAGHQPSWLEKNIAKLVSLRVAKEGQAANDKGNLEEEAMTPPRG